MLLTITTTAPDASAIGHLLHKNPASVFRRELSFGEALVFYPEASASKATCALLVKVDPVGLVRGRRGALGLDQFVNDRPFVASSLVAVAISRCFGTAMNGTAKVTDRLMERWPLEVIIPAIACAGGEALIRSLFEPLGYDVVVTGGPLDSRFPDWGEANVFRVELRGAQTIQALLNHLYVLLPALDRRKHYYVGDDEVDKLLAKGKEWLKDHPAKEAIVRRYLKYRAELTHKALSQLQVDLAPDEDSDGEEMALEQAVDSQLPASPSGADVASVVEDEEKKPRLQEVRHNTVLAALRDPAADVRSVLDIGCAGGHFLRTLAKERRFERIAGMDVSVQALQHAAKRLWLKQGRDSERLTLFHGSLLYRDRRLAGFDAITLIEVIEHLDPPRLRAAERVIFEQSRPRMVLVTTPNIEYNVVWAELPAGTLRHRDHRFEWTRPEFADWCARLSTRFGYSITSHEIGPRSIEHPAVGTPTQMAVFRRTADR